MQAKREELTDLAAMIDGGREVSGFVWRLAAWGGAAALSLAVVIVAVTSETGSRRLAQSAGGRSDNAAPKPASRTLDMELELRRMSESVRTLALDRDRLQSRIAMLERNLDEVSVTGSIPPNPARAAPPLGSAAAPAAAPMGALPRDAAAPNAAGLSAPPAPAAPANASFPPPALAEPKARAEPETKPPATPHDPLPSKPRAAAQSQSGEGASGAARVIGGHAAAAPPSASETVVTKTEFGIDVGGDRTVEGLRGAWAMLRASHPALFEGLRPVVSVRDGQKPGSLELRLVAGPLANASTAARYCAALAVAGVACQPAVFDGQRLALQ